jgi:hypothetical protein
MIKLLTKKGLSRHRRYERKSTGETSEGRGFHDLARRLRSQKSQAYCHRQKDYSQLPSKIQMAVPTTLSTELEGRSFQMVEITATLVKARNILALSSADQDFFVENRSPARRSFRNGGHPYGGHAYDGHPHDGHQGFGHSKNSDIRIASVV